MISLKINNKDIKAKKEMTVFQAAESAGIDIPALCNHPNLSPYGGCRLCIVQIEGMPGYPTSCTTPVTEGMVVRTNTPEVVKLRKNILKLLLSEHTSPCIVCLHKEQCQEYRPNPIKSGKIINCHTCSNFDKCELRALAEEYNVDDFELPILYKNISPEKQDPFMDRDYNLCILCGKCVRICKEIHGKSPIDFINRGQDTRINTAFNRSHTQTECCFCGVCIDICPTGAFSDKSSKWYGTPEKIEEIKCALCPVNCSVKLKIKNDKVIGAESAALTQKERFCALGRFILPQVYKESDLVVAAAEKLSGFAKKELIQTIIADIKKKMGKSSKKAEIISVLKSISTKKGKKSVKTDKGKEERFKITSKKEIVPSTYMFTIYAPDIAKKCQPGQFVIAIAKENSERIPYTIAGWDSEAGTVTINVLEAGRATQKMVELDEGDCVAHFVGPLGVPVKIKKYGTVVCAGGCFGVGAILPMARALKEAGNKVICVEEASSSYLLYWQDKLSTCCDELIIVTKDGSSGIKGGIQEAITILSERGEKIDQAFVVGCTFMMMLVSKCTKELDIPTIVALNPIMIDGTGMCGACRVSIDGQTKFACVDGPNFDGHKVDWDLLRVRRRAYINEEMHSSHVSACHLKDD